MRRKLWLWMAVVLLVVADSPLASERVTLSGKTVWGDMAVEDVDVRVERWDGSEWKEVQTIFSHYHGSFRVRVAPGRYRLAARTRLTVNREPLPLVGRLGPLEVASGTARMDRLVIELAPEGQPPSE